MRPVQNLWSEQSANCANIKVRKILFGLAAIIAKKFQNVKFLIVGADNSENQNYQTYLENLADELDLKNQIIFTGWQENMPMVFAALDIFVSSARSETFGLVIAEAMAGAKAIVATETDGAKELIENKKSGKLVAVREPLKLAGAINEFLSDEKMRETYGENAQKKAREKFSLDRMITETENVYKSVLA